MREIFFEDFPFNPEKILASADAATMDSKEFGVYCRLLFVSWTQRPQCYYKLDVEQICKLCRISVEEWEQVKPAVLKKFVLTYLDPSGEVPYIYNEKLLSIYNKKLKERRGSGNGKQLSGIAQMLNYPFAEFWEDYDKKVGDKNRLIPKWLKLSDVDREEIRIDIPKRKEFQPDKRLRLNPEKYLNGKRWKDELIDQRIPIKKGKQEPRKNADYNEQKHNPI